MDRIVGRVFNPEYVQIVELETPDPDFSGRIHGIKCKYCDKTYTYDADFMLDHLQYQHKISIKDMLKQ